MNAAVAKKTQETLGKVIKKPALTEKLLNRPPFRFLRDIFVEVIKSTGFMKGLYGESELSSDALDKDSKIAFLQKAIDVVMLVSGEPLAVKPVRIVCGHEPEKTNEMLQAIAKCCLNKMSSDEAVRRVLSGEKIEPKTKASTSRSQDKENREGRELNLDKEEKKKITANNDRGEQKDPAHHKEQDSRRRDGEKEHHRGRERSDKHQRREQEGHTKDKSREQERDKEKDKARSREKDRERHHERDKDKERDRERHHERDKDKERDRERHHERDKDKEKDRDRHHDSHAAPERDKDKQRGRGKERQRERNKEPEERNKSGESSNSKTNLPERAQKRSSPEELHKTTKSVPAPAEEAETQQPSSPARIPRPSSAKGQRRRPKNQEESDSEGDGEALLAQRPAPQENGDGSSVPKDVASSSRRNSRPSSARPAPPQIKKQENQPEVAPAERGSSAKTSVPIILDGKRPSEEDENESRPFIGEEMVPLPQGVPQLDAYSEQELNNGEQHGALVKKILETKKDYETSTPSKLKNIESEVAQKKEREMVKQETERVCSSIQTMCRSTQFLAKNLDYVQENIDAMQAELIFLRQESKKYMQACEEEQRMTDKALEPHYTELVDLEQQIMDTWSKIRTSRANILKNEEKREKLLRGISFHHSA
ncbi:TRAF3-interacting protein 1 [Takifugu flavidus]|uniref:TRAF3-interacting protein 1 n=1 Tax=Takifugu flavidus TaxID=433684 RepID=A0A5C6PM97_9TELE|nr:TRAF3-interacting protein 1 [Takifugu flavidus]